MNNFFKTFLMASIIYLLPSSKLFAESIEMTVVNGKTREEKKFLFGSNLFEIDVQFVKGWSKCVALPKKIFEYNGALSVRGELYCRTKTGQTQSVSCVAQKNEVSVTITNIFGSNFKVIDEKNIQSDSYAEITLMCSNL